jgi:hypothetical protein
MLKVHPERESAFQGEPTPMFKRTVTISILLVVVTIRMHIVPAHASGSAWITDASCRGLTIEGNSSQPLLIATAFNAADPSGPSIGYVFRQEDSAIGHFTAYLPFGTFDRIGDPVTPVAVPSYTTVHIEVTDYRTIEPDTDPSVLGEITLSVVCPDWGGVNIPGGFEQHLSLCYTRIFSTPSQDKPLGNYVIGSKMTQYAKSTPVQGLDGRLWNEL